METKNIYIMKKYLKKISLLALIVTVFSCNDSDIDSVLKNTTSGGF
jgi:hypothetical protein